MIAICDEKLLYYGMMSKGPVLFLFLILGLAGNAQPSRIILAVFAHPDDETTIAPVLAKYGEYNQVYVLIATDGRFGVTDHAGIDAGDSLVKIRNQELACSCRKLGINKPIQLGLPDQLGSPEGMGAYFSHLATLKKELAKVITDLKPDVVVTFGPDADSGHPDHRLVGIVTTEVLLKDKWPANLSLYYFSWTKQQADKFPEWNLNYTHQTHLNTKISFLEKHEEMSYEAIRCYQSQYSEEELDRWIGRERADPLNVLYFREFATSKEIREDF